MLACRGERVSLDAGYLTPAGTWCGVHPYLSSISVARPFYVEAASDPHYDRRSRSSR
jgi:hypothetical protein